MHSLICGTHSGDEQHIGGTAEYEIPIHFRRETESEISKCPGIVIHHLHLGQIQIYVVLTTGHGVGAQAAGLQTG